MAKHILFISLGFPENEEDSASFTPIQFYLKTLSQKTNFQCSLISTHYPYTKKNYKWFNVDVYLMGSQHTFLKKLFSFFKIKNLIKTIHKRKPIDCIHCFWLNKNAYIANEFCTKKRIPLLITIMGRDALKENRWLKQTSKWNATFFTLSYFHHQKLIQSCGLNSKIAHLGIPEYPTSSEKKDIDILNVGWLFNVKNQDLFIDTLALIKKQIPNCKAIIAGDGELMPHLKAKARKLELENNLVFAGRVSNETIRLYMRRSKVLLHCSNFESFGLVLIEAQTERCWVVSTPVGIAFENESIFKGKTPEELCNRVMSLINKEAPKPNLFYSMDKMIETYSTYYPL